MRGRYNPRESNREHRNRRQERRNNFKFNRRGNNDSFRDRRRNFIHQRRRFNNRPFKRGEKLNEEKLNQELDNYFEKKGGESLKDYLDNDLEMYKNKENLKKENVEENIKKAEKKLVILQGGLVQLENELAKYKDSTMLAEHQIDIMIRLIGIIINKEKKIYLQYYNKLRDEYKQVFNDLGRIFNIFK